MKTNYMNTSLRDIVFENRNKQYGAYVLRQEQDVHLIQASAFTIGATILILLIGYLHATLSPTPTSTYTPGIHILEDLPKILVVEKTEIEVQKEKPKPLAKSTIRNTEMKFVSESSARTDTFATQELLRAFDSGVNTNVSLDYSDLGRTDGTGTEVLPDVPAETIVEPAFMLHPEVMPEFEGGDAALFRYLAKETQYPVREKDLDIQGKALVRFVVTKEGKISNSEIIRSDSPGFSAEAIRVVKTLKGFKPGMQAGRTVNVQLVLPFHFRLNN